MHLALQSVIRYIRVSRYSGYNRQDIRLGGGMMTTISLSEAKDRLSKLVKETAETTEPFMISVHGRKEVVVISMVEYAGLMETIEILRDQTLVQKIQAGLQEAKKGQLVDFDSIKENV